MVNLLTIYKNMYIIADADQPSINSNATATGILYTEVLMSLITIISCFIGFIFKCDMALPVHTDRRTTVDMTGVR